MKIVKTQLWIVALGTFVPWTSLFAEEGAAASYPVPALAALGAALGIAIAVFACGLAQGKITAAYLDGVARNPGAQKLMFTPLILGLAFVETLVLFTILIQMMVLGKV